MAEGAISNLLSTVAPFIQNEFNLLRGVRDEIDLIRGEYEQMSAFLQEAGANENNNPQFEVWVKQVREAAYDAGDVLELFMVRLEHHHGDGCFWFLCEAFNFMKTIIVQHQIAVEVQRIKLKVNEISQSRQRYANYTEVQASSSNTVSTSTVYNNQDDALQLKENEIVGITDPKSKLIKWLVNENRHELQVISVSGMGGLGKTTLVKKVYDDAEIVKKFEAHAWITVSKSFRIKELLKGLIKELYSELNRQVPDTVEDKGKYGLNRLINEFLKEKRYVIVLDDVWNTDVWNAIRYAFPHNNCSSRVILTTRDKYVASSVGEVYELLPLPEKESWTLFCRKAFKGKSCPQGLEETTKAILKKCGGLPLAIVAIGGLLATKDESLDEWDKINRGLGAELEEEGNLVNVKKVLSLSYFDLPWYLKLCFLYLSILPEDYVIDHWRLIRLWVAEGFVQSTPRLTSEEVADNYLNKLLNRSLILPTSPKKFEGGKRYHIHDIWRELIFSKSIKQDLVTIFGAEQSSFPHRVRRLSIHNKTRDWQENKHLTTHVHSLLMFGSIDSESKSSIVDYLGKGARLLKVLDVSNSSLATFPPQIGKLIHLKYLSLRGSDIEEVPKSIGDLKMLETLDLKDTKVRELPDEILKLHRLRHLLVYRYPNSLNNRFHNHFGFKVPKGIEKLSCLQKLCSIELNRSDNDGIVRDLAALTQLRRINILQLRNSDANELSSTLEKLTKLRSLSISMIDESEILNLDPLSSPPRFLHTLFLTGRIVNLPRWISSLHNLAKLGLNFNKSNEDPLPWLKDMPNLTRLVLNHAYEGGALSFEADTFKKLASLTIYSSDNLRFVSVTEGAMPRLKVLVINKCPSMEELPSGIETLRHLTTFFLVDMPDSLISSLNPDMENENARKIAHIATVFITTGSGTEAEYSYILSRYGRRNIFSN